jgi:hypothetical protein
MRGYKRSFGEWKTIIDKFFSDSNRFGFKLRLTGGLAIRLQCSDFENLFVSLKREYEDIDFVCQSMDTIKIRNYFQNLDFQFNKEVFTYSEGKRMIFTNTRQSLKVDVFVDVLDFSHFIDLTDRFKIDSRTISISDLLLSKMQIVKISQKDFIDIAALLVEHSFSDSEQPDKINIKYISALLADDWGFFHTFEKNLNKLENYLIPEIYNGAIKNELHLKIITLKQRVEATPKSLKWKMRAKIGESLNWYKEVSEI